ncbi:MAG TPA: histidine--tRNA ligase [Candidatus Binataceae bacterium]|nr:histidine--tRNA ligase [Candidatus Binataceae bacterium]
MELTRLRGFQDLLGPSARAVAHVEERARAIARRYAIEEIRIPMLERLELYERSSGETSDVVQKQMYLVRRHEESDPERGEMALRPEGTPGVVRAYIEAGLDKGDPEQRFFYLGPMLRYERPQKGRYRQFHQFGVELLGRADAAADAELMFMIDDLRRELGLELSFEVNSLGDAKCRPAYRAALLAWGRAHLDQLCEDCHQRIDRNPLRLLDCKVDARLAESAPRSVDFLCDECHRHFDLVRELLSSARVPFEVNPRLVRGLDYYTRTAFEVVSTAVGAQNAVAAGGRYDGLVEALGGAPVAGTGFAIGIERIALALDAAKLGGARADVVIIALGEKALAPAVAITRELREQNLRVEMLSPERGLRALLRRADRLGVRLAAIIGDDEIARGAVQLRDLKTSTQSEVPHADLARLIRTTRD